MAAYKPTLIKIRGVHAADATGSNIPDIGFPLGMENIFKNATIQDYSGGYDSSKDLVYKDDSAYKKIEDENHFNCIKNGYKELPGADHFYALNDGNYIFIPLSTDDSWKSKYENSLLFAGSIMPPYKISREEEEHIKIGDTFYEKDANNNNYIAKNPVTYNVYEPAVIDWEGPFNDGYKENDNGDFITDGDGRLIEYWLDKNGTPATNGNYFFIDETNDTIEYLGNIGFDDEGSNPSDNVPKNGMVKLPVGIEITKLFGLHKGSMEKIQKNYNYDYSEGLYYKYSWQYPNTEYPEISAETKIYDGSIKDFNKEDYRPYVEATATVLPVTEHQNQQIMERTGELLHYKYNDSDTIHIPLVSGTVEDIAEKCSLSKEAEKYIHLTNLIYHKS